MPVHYNKPAQTAPSASGSTIRYNRPTPPDEGSGLLPAAAAAAAGAGVYALTKNPNITKTAWNGLMDLRRMSMLSGMAPLKSFLGNMGGTVFESIERGSMAPIREFFSPVTAREAVAAFKAGPNYANAGPATGITKLNLPGRIMGALDEAGQSALRRSGLSAKEAEAAMLQTPLDPKTANALENPVMEYLVPFRRTPFNQFREGAATFGADTAGKKVALGTALGTGFVEGSTIDDPKTQALATAAAGRYGLPTAMAAAAARAMRGKNPGAVLQGMSPVSDYSLTEGVAGPIVSPSRIIPRPALLGLIDYINSLGR